MLRLGAKNGQLGQGRMGRQRLTIAQQHGQPFVYANGTAGAGNGGEKAVTKLPLGDFFMGFAQRGEQIVQLLQGGFVQCGGEGNGGGHE